MPPRLETIMFHPVRAAVMRLLHAPDQTHGDVLRAIKDDSVRLGLLADATCELFRSHFGLAVHPSGDDLSNWLRLSFVETRLMTMCIGVSNGS